MRGIIPKIRENGRAENNVSKCLTSYTLEIGTKHKNISTRGRLIPHQTETLLYKYLELSGIPSYDEARGTSPCLLPLSLQKTRQGQQLKGGPGLILLVLPLLFPLLRGYKKETRFHPACSSPSPGVEVEGAPILLLQAFSSPRACPVTISSSIEERKVLACRTRAMA